MSQPQHHRPFPRRLFRNLSAKIAALPMIAHGACRLFVGGTLWTVFYSFTNSKLLPREKFVGFDQYERLWSTSRWLISIENLMIYGILFSLIFSLVIGFSLAALLDQKIRFENTFRTICSIPSPCPSSSPAWSGSGSSTRIRHSGHRPGLGWESFTFDPLYNPDIVIFGVLIAGLWQGTGFIMCLMLAGCAASTRTSGRLRVSTASRCGRPTSLHRHSDDASGVHHHAGDHRDRHRQALRP
jgi:glucose/mannose transport system permease protein